MFHLAAQTIVADGQPRADLDVRDEHPRHLARCSRRAALTAPNGSSSPRRTRRTGPTRAALPRGLRARSRSTPTTSPRRRRTCSPARTGTPSQLPVAVTRFANLYGGGDTNRSRLVPEAVAAALAGRAPVVRSDGSPERDFLYVEDAVDAYLAIWRGARSGRGSRRGVQRRRRARPPRARRRQAHLPARRDRRRRRTSAAPGLHLARSTASGSTTAKLQALTGWEPSVTLEEGLRRTIEWYRAQPSKALRRPFTGRLARLPP